MRNNIYIALFLLTFYFTNAQTDNYIVTYKVVKHIDEENKLEKIYLATLKNYRTITDEFEYVLIFNKEKSFFFIKDKLYSDKYAAELGKVTLDYFGRVEQHKDYFITENLEEEFGRFLVKRSYQDWTLHKDETKMIDNYLCFKATTFYTVTNPKGKVFTYNFIAWYAPQLPYKYGPIGYGNLSGLILELQTDGYTYGVKKIEFTAEDGKKIKMPKLKKLKLITEEELERLATINEGK